MAENSGSCGTNTNSKGCITFIKGDKWIWFHNIKKLDQSSFCSNEVENQERSRESEEFYTELNITVGFNLMGLYYKSRMLLRALQNTELYFKEDNQNVLNLSTVTTSYWEEQNFVQMW